MSKRNKRGATSTTSEDGTCSEGSGEPSPKRVTAPANTTSRYRGVTKHRHTLKWEAHLWDSDYVRAPQEKGGKGKARRHGRQVYLGGYATEEEAAQAYDRASLVWWGKGTPLNFPIEKYEGEMGSLLALSREELVQELRRRSTTFARGHSRYRGVTQHTPGLEGKWDARIGRVNGNKYMFLGTYTTDLEAAVAYDLATLTHRASKAITNFPAILYKDDQGRLLSLEEATKRCTDYHASTAEGKGAAGLPPSLPAATAGPPPAPRARTGSVASAAQAPANSAVHVAAVQALRKQLKAAASAAASQAGSVKPSMPAPTARPRPPVSKAALLQQHVQQRMTIPVPPPELPPLEGFQNGREVTTTVLHSAAPLELPGSLPTASATIAQATNVINNTNVITSTSANTNFTPSTNTNANIMFGAEAQAPLLASVPPLTLTTFDGLGAGGMLASTDLDFHLPGMAQPAYISSSALAPLPPLPLQPQQGVVSQEPMMHRVLDMLSLPSRGFSQFSQFLGRISNPGSSLFVAGTSVSMPPPVAPPAPAPIHAPVSQLAMAGAGPASLQPSSEVLPSVTLPMQCQNVLVANLQDSVYEEMLNALLAPGPGEAPRSSSLAGWDDTALLLVPNRTRRAGSSGSILLAAGPPGVQPTLQTAPSGALGQPLAYFI